MKKIIKQEQWVLLPVEKNGALSINYLSDTWKTITNRDSEVFPNHLYLTSDEKIKVGDWCIDVLRKMIFQPKDDPNFPPNTEINSMEYLHKSGRKFWKIIATTDKSLVIGFVETDKDGKGSTGHPLPQIPESFVRHYIDKQGEVGDVEMEYREDLAGTVWSSYVIAQPKLTEQNETIIQLSKEHWDDELEKCKASPYYFYTNYYTTVNGDKATTRLSEEEFNKMASRI